jgi:hypothetical protein
MQLHLQSFAQDAPAVAADTARRDRELARSRQRRAAAPITPHRAARGPGSDAPCSSSATAPAVAAPPLEMLQRRAQVFFLLACNAFWFTSCRS